MIRPDADPADIGGLIINPVRINFTQLFIGEIMYPHRLWIALGPPLTPSILEITHEFFLFSVNRDNGVPALLEYGNLIVDVIELSISVGMMRTFSCFLIGLQAIA